MNNREYERYHEYDYFKSRLINSVLATLAIVLFIAFINYIAGTVNASLGEGTAGNIVPASADIAAALARVHPVETVRRVLCTVSPWLALFGEYILHIIRMIIS